MNTDKAVGQILSEANDLAAQGRQSEAIWLLENHTAEFLNVLALMYHHYLGDKNKAERLLAAALDVKPGNWLVYSNLAHVRAIADEQQHALSAAIKAAQCCDNSTHEPYYNLGVILADLGRTSDAALMYEEAYKISPENNGIAYNLATTLLKLGRFNEGWPLFEKRFTTSPVTENFVKRFKQPTWDGKKTKQSLCVFSEQGIGDFLQFARFLPEIKKKVGKLIVEVQNPVGKLLEANPQLKIDQIVTRPDETDGLPGPWSDLCVSINSLPALLQIDHESQIPNKTYLHAPKRMKHRGFPKNKLKVGLCWAGNSNHKKDSTRSMALSWLRPFADVPNVQTYSLQKGGFAVRQWPTGWIDLNQGINEYPLIDLTKFIEDFADLAYFVNQLDLVITVDTGLAHLVGAMGKPVWMMLPADRCDWRWGDAGEKSVWYPSMKIFRQPKYNDWKSVIDEVVSQLSSYRTSQD